MDGRKDSTATQINYARPERWSFMTLRA
jgi:hypothetical protein